MIWQPEVFQVCKSGYNQPLGTAKILKIIKEGKMHITRVFLILFSILILTCNSSNQDEIIKTQTPSVLEEDLSKSRISYSSSGYQILNELYEEALKENKDLNEIENFREELLEKKSDQKEILKTFEHKNETYYIEARYESDQIQNKLLRKKLAEIIEKSASKYQSRMKEIKSLSKIADSLGVSLSDHRNILKVVYTLPFIENFQKTNNPDNKNAKDLIKQFEKAITKSNGLINQANIK